MTALVFVDTNVLVYAHESSEPDKQARALEWVDTLWREQRGRTSAQVLSEFYAVVTRKIKTKMNREDAWEYVQDFIAWNPQPIDTRLIARAYELEGEHRLSWWDCLIVGAAQFQGCAILLTEDLHDGAHFGGVTVRNPFKLGVAQASATYVAAPKLESRYRGRGRPRKARSPAAA
jgi:predicted nucleic acid-binding protein